MEIYKIFRKLNIICFILLVGFVVAYYFTLISQSLFTTSMAIIAALITIFGLFAIKPIGPEDVSVAIDKTLMKYEAETFEQLKKAKEEEQKISDFIENKSNEIFLLKLRSYLEEEILTKYKGSELSKLINELEKIEQELDSINTPFSEIELPDRFKKIVRDLNKEDKFEMYIDLIDALPFFPLKSSYKAYLRLLKKM